MKRRPQLNDFSFHIKKPEKEEQIKGKVRPKKKKKKRENNKNSDKQ